MLLRTAEIPVRVLLNASRLFYRRTKWSQPTLYVRISRSVHPSASLKLISKWKGPCGIPRCRMDLREIGREGMDWIHLAQDRDQWKIFVNTIINLQFQ
jgi:hypothetical protein